MQISFRRNNTTEASITIRIEETDYQARVSRRIKEHSKKANIKGFRPGSVPGAVIQQRYGRSILIEEVNALLAESLAQYLKEHEIHALGEPMPVLEQLEAIDWEHQRDFELAYAIGMAGPFSCDLSKDLKVTAHRLTRVAEQTVDNLVEQLRKAHGETAVVGKSAADDVIHGVLHYPKQDFTVKTTIPIGELAEKARKIFVSLSPQDDVSFDVKQVFKKPVKLPAVTEEMYATMLKRGGSATFTVEKIYRRLPAAITQALFDKVLGQKVACNEQDFRTKLKARLLQHKQQEADFRLEQSIQAALSSKAAIALPDNFMKAWLQERNKIPKEQIETYYVQYAKALRWRLLVEALSRKHGLEATDEEVVAEVRDRLQATLSYDKVAQPPSKEHIEMMVQNFLKEHDGAHYRKVYDSVHMRKVINFIKDHITIVVQEASVEAFDALVLA